MSNLSVRLLLPGLFAALAAFSSAPARAQAVDSLVVPGPVEFMGTTYEFTWAGGDEQGFFLQEYLPGGQAVEA